MPANFDHIARAYRWLEYLTLGPTLQRCRTHFIPQLREQTHVLVLGDGDGRFLARLYAVHPLLRATAVDTSTAMLALLRRNCEQASSHAETRLRTSHSNALEHTPAADTSLIAAHFFFDCLTQSEIDALIARFTAHVQQDALWLVSDFRIPAGFMHHPATLLVRLLYFAFRLLTGLRTSQLPDYQMSFRKSDITLVAQHLSLRGVLSTELWRHTSAAPSSRL